MKPFLPTQSIFESPRTCLVAPRSTSVMLTTQFYTSVKRYSATFRCRSSCLVFSCPRSEGCMAARRANSLHLSLSSTLLSKSTIGRCVHVAMLFIHVMRCPSFLLDPGNVPCMISFSRLSPCFRMI